MKTLLTFVDELIKFLPNKKTTHLLEIDEFTLTNFRFNGFIKKESELKFKSKNLTHLIKFLIYFEFIKENKRACSACARARRVWRCWRAGWRRSGCPTRFSCDR